MEDIITKAFSDGASAKRRIPILDDRGPSDPEFIAVSQRAAKLGPALSILALVIIWLMVAKPV